MEKGAAQEPRGVRGNPSYILSCDLEFYPSASSAAIHWGEVPIWKGQNRYDTTDTVVFISNPVN